MAKTDKTVDKTRQENKQFKKTQQRAEEAWKLLANPSKNRSAVWTKKEQGTRKLLAIVKKTKCLYFQKGCCRDGHNCPYLHNSISTGGMRGILYKYKQYAPKGLYAFVRLTANGEEVFVSKESLVGMVSLKKPRHQTQKRIVEKVEAWCK